MKHFLFGIVASAVVSAGLQSQSTPQSATQGALALLEQVGRHYVEAKSYHIESVEERTFSNAYQRNWAKTVLTAAEAPGHRYHYEGLSDFGRALRVSDGKSVWTYHFDEGRYTVKPVVTGTSDEPKVIPEAEVALTSAQSLRKTLGDLPNHYKSATRLSDEAVIVNGHDVSCYVVRIQNADLKRSRPEYSLEMTIWIDKAHETILKTLEHAHTYIVSGGAHIPFEEEATTLYSLTDLDAGGPDSLFTFTPPLGAKLIEEFPDPSKHGSGPDLAGQAAPSLELKSFDGKSVSLDSFRGKPILLDLWATWCAPCVSGLAQLARIHQETKVKGLVVISVDQDEEAKTAVDLLAAKGYSWPNFHDDGEVSKALGFSGIPRTLLIDAQGKIVYDRMEYTEDDLRTAIANLGTEYASLAPKPRQAPCEASK